MTNLRALYGATVHVKRGIVHLANAVITNCTAYHAFGFIHFVILRAAISALGSYLTTSSPSMETSRSRRLLYFYLFAFLP